jgi:hypothetical protein
MKRDAKKQRKGDEMGRVTETIFDGKEYVIPMADVSHVQRSFHQHDTVDGDKCGDFLGITIITKHTTWNPDGGYHNSIWMTGEDAQEFLRAWCNYRHELDEVVSW